MNVRLVTLCMKMIKHIHVKFLNLLVLYMILETLEIDSVKNVWMDISLKMENVKCVVIINC